jgi:hypothetical protein
MRVHRAALRLSSAQRDELEAHLTRLLDEAEHDQDDDGTWTRVLVTMVDLQHRSELKILTGRHGDRRASQAAEARINFR